MQSDHLSDLSAEFVGAGGNGRALHVKWALPFPKGAKRMQGKNVFIDECRIGEAATWGEVHALMKARGILFINGPRGAEGPSGFYLTGKPVEHSRTVSQRPAVG